MQNLNQRTRGMLGFAMRAGKLLIGTEIVCKAMAKGNIKLVLISSEASDGTKKKLLVKCEFYNVRIIQLNISTDSLGTLLGKSYSPAVIGVTDEGFADEIEKSVKIIPSDRI